jgi:hypothetical protein
MMVAKLAQLYIHDTDHEIKNRIKALCKDDDIEGELDRKIVLMLMDMLV